MPPTQDQQIARLELHADIRRRWHAIREEIVNAVDPDDPATIERINTQISELDQRLRDDAEWLYRESIENEPVPPNYIRAPIYQGRLRQLPPRYGVQLERGPVGDTPGAQLLRARARLAEGDRQAFDEQLGPLDIPRDAGATEETALEEVLITRFLDERERNPPPPRRTHAEIVAQAENDNNDEDNDEILVVAPARGQQAVLPQGPPNRPAHQRYLRTVNEETWVPKKAGERNWEELLPVGYRPPMRTRAPLMLDGAENMIETLNSRMQEGVERTAQLGREEEDADLAEEIADAQSSDGSSGSDGGESSDGDGSDIAHSNPGSSGIGFPGSEHSRPPSHSPSQSPSHSQFYDSGSSSSSDGPAGDQALIAADAAPDQDGDVPMMSGALGPDDDPMDVDFDDYLVYSPPSGSQHLDSDDEALDPNPNNLPLMSGGLGPDDEPMDVDSNSDSDGTLHSIPPIAPLTDSSDRSDLDSDGNLILPSGGLRPAEIGDVHLTAQAVEAVEAVHAQHAINPPPEPEDNPLWPRVDNWDDGSRDNIN